MAKSVFTRSFTKTLTDREIVERAREQARLHREREQVKGARREALASFRDQLAGVDHRLDQLASVVTDGTERVDIDCEWRPHPSAPRWQIVALEAIDEKRPAHTVVDELAMTLIEIAQLKSGTLPLTASGAAIVEEQEEGGANDGGADVEPVDEDEEEGEDDEAAVDGASTATASAEEANGHAVEELALTPAVVLTPTKKRRTAAKPVLCSALIEESGDSPTDDRICGEPGSRRMGGFCGPHNGNLSPAARTRAVARRKQREAAQARGNAAREGTEERAPLDEMPPTV